MSWIASFLIGQAAKKGAARFEAATKEPAKAQEALLQQRMQKNRDTEYGREYGFAEVTDRRSYAERVPVVDYEAIRERIDRVTSGAENILTAENPILFAQTSGTTGKPKFIPVTPTCRSGGGMTTWLHYIKRDHPGAFKGKIFSIVSPAVEGHTDGGLPYGSTSGMIVKEMPKVVQGIYAVPYPAFEIHEYESKYYALLRFGLAENVTFMATANPSSILKLAEMADTMADRLIKDIHDGTLDSSEDISTEIRDELAPRLGRDPERAKFLEKCRAKRSGKLLPIDYWPEMALLGCWKGGTVGSYIERLREWYDPDKQGMVPVRDPGYLASEARMSIPVTDHGAGGVLTLHNNVFEFVSADEIDDNPEAQERWSFLGAEELEIGSQYYVFITTSGGLYRYDINDVIERVDTYNNAPVVVFRRKGRGMTNLTGEKLSVNQVIEAVEKAGTELGHDVAHFKAEPDIAQSRYVFKIEAPGLAKEQRTGLLVAIDRSLGELNIEYLAKRGSGRLKAPVLEVMKNGWYDRGKQAMAAEGKRLFQAKTVLLDAKSGYHPEPEETEASVELPSS